MAIIEEFPNYSIDIKGNVYNTKNNKYCHFNKDNYGYILVNLRKENIWYKRKVHRLLALSYLPNPENKCDVNHIDGNKSNNDLSNLEWATRSENMKHAYRIGLSFISNKNIEQLKKRSSKKVLDTKTKIIYESATFAAMKLGINKNTLKGYLVGNYKNKTTLIYV